MIDNSKPSIGVLFTAAAFADKTKPFRMRNISRVHATFSRKAKEHDMNVFYAFHKEFENGKLKNCWYRQNNRWKLTFNQKIDIVYSRFAGSIYKTNRKDKNAELFKYKVAEQVSMANHPLIDEFCWDKTIIAEALGEHCPKTFLVNTGAGLSTVLPEIKSDKVVIKPRYGSLGNQVIITEKDNLPGLIDKNTIVQEYIDTTKGIKGIVNGVHDMRLVMINGKLDHAHIRMPRKGLLTANIALGGKKFFIENKMVPKKAKAIAKKVDKLLKNFYPRIYSVDFVFNEKGIPYIVECNSQPMIDKYAFGKYAMIDFYDRILDALKAGIKVAPVQKRQILN